MFRHILLWCIHRLHAVAMDNDERDRMLKCVLAIEALQKRHKINKTVANHKRHRAIKITMHSKCASELLTSLESIIESTQARPNVRGIKQDTLPSLSKGTVSVDDWLADNNGNYLNADDVLNRISDNLKTIRELYLDGVDNRNLKEVLFDHYQNKPDIVYNDIETIVDVL